MVQMKGGAEVQKVRRTRCLQVDYYSEMSEHQLSGRQTDTQEIRFHQEGRTAAKVGVGGKGKRVNW